MSVVDIKGSLSTGNLGASLAKSVNDEVTPSPSGRQVLVLRRVIMVLRVVLDWLGIEL